MDAGAPHSGRSLDTYAQAGRRRFARQPLAYQALQGVDAFALGGERRIGRHPRLEGKCVGGVELAVYVGVDQARGIFRNHRARHDALLPMVLITWLRPRASRDITVPIGTPVTSAISR